MLICNEKFFLCCFFFILAPGWMRIIRLYYNIYMFDYDFMIWLPNMYIYILLYTYHYYPYDYTFDLCQVSGLLGNARTIISEGRRVSTEPLFSLCFMGDSPDEKLHFTMGCSYHRIGWWEKNTGKPDQFDGKKHGFRLSFSLKPIHWS